MSLEYTRATALYVLDRHARQTEANGVHFVGTAVYCALPSVWVSRFGHEYTEEEKRLQEWAKPLARQLAAAIKDPIFEMFRKRVRAAKSVDEVDDLMFAIMGVRYWKSFYAPYYAAKHIGGAAREALADPGAELCRRRLKREFTELQ